MTQPTSSASWRHHLTIAAEVATVLTFVVGVIALLVS